MHFLHKINIINAVKTLPNLQGKYHFKWNCGLSFREF